MKNHSKRNNVTTKATESSRTETRSDECLMEAYMAGETTCLEALIHRYEHELFGFLRRMVVDPALAEDVFQSTFVQVHIKREYYEPGRPVRPWLYKIATNQALDAMRRGKRHRLCSLDRERGNGFGGSTTSMRDSLASGDTSAEERAEVNERRELVRQAVDGLAENQRAVVVLSYFQGLKYQQIAEILRIPVGTVKSRLHAAVGRLAEQWKKLGLDGNE